MKIKDIFVEKFINLIKNDSNFLKDNSNEKDSFGDWLGLPKNKTQSYVIKLGRILDKAINKTIITYANENNISVKNGDEYIILEKTDNKHHKGEQQIDHHYITNINNIETLYIDENKANPLTDTGKTCNIIEKLCSAYNIVKLKNEKIIIKLGYSSLNWNKESKQHKKMLYIKDKVEKSGASLNIWTCNNFITDVLGITKSEFTDIEFSDALVEIGNFVNMIVENNENNENINITSIKKNLKEKNNQNKLPLFTTESLNTEKLINILQNEL
jgi:hypothetical protein